MFFLFRKQKKINKIKDVKRYQSFIFYFRSYDMESNHIKSIFRDASIGKEEYTRVWIDLINQLEKKKSVVFSPQT